MITSRLTCGERPGSCPSHPWSSRSRWGRPSTAFRASDDRRNRP